MAQLVKAASYSKKPPKPFNTAYIAGYELLDDADYGEMADIATRLLGLELLFDSEEPHDVLLFAGGTDINPAMYGEKPLPTTQKSDMLRDGREIYHWQVGQTRIDVPLNIGVCRGAQFLNVMAGGKLWQHVDGHHGAHSVWYNNMAHSGITSDHHQMMIVPENGKEKKIRHSILAYASGLGDRSKIRMAQGSIPRGRDTTGNPECIWYPDVRNLCVQFHPGWDLEGPSGKLFKQIVKDVLASEA